jgi:hypothetical protein
LPIHPRLSGLAAVLLLCLAACTSSPQPTGSAQFAVSIPQALSSTDISRVKLTLSAPDISSLSVDLARANGSWGGILGNLVPGSNRTFLAEAFDSSGSLRFKGQTSGVTITAHHTTAVALTLQELSPPPPFENEAPLILSLVASSTSVSTGGSLSLNASIHDPNAGDTLSLAWSSSSGSFSDSSSATTSWSAPSSPGIYTLTLTVSDSQGAAVSLSLAINVVSGASSGAASLDISFNFWPTVSNLSASLSRLDVGQSTSVSVSASDSNGDSLSYQWESSCPGSWTNPSSSSASFVPSSLPSGSCNNCLLTVTLQDGRGGHTTGSLALCVASSSTELFPPSFTNDYQSSSSASPGLEVVFDVTALDPQSSSLTFSWSTNTGSLASPQDTSSSSRILWTAPSCAPPDVTPTITSTVTNAHGLSASRPFSLSGLPTCASPEPSAP